MESVVVRDQTELESRLRTAASEVRVQALKMVHRSKTGHPGGDLSCADVLVSLYLGVLNIDAREPAWSGRDRFIMSKGHCSAVLYATLAKASILTQADIDTFMGPLSSLNGHPDRNKVPGVEASTGPLGHGLPIGVGCALAAKMQKANWHTFVLTGDGELNEGSNWEAAMCAKQYKLDNLTLIVDRNRIQQGDFTNKIIDMDPMGDKWRAFGWSVVEVDGHDFGQLSHVLGARSLEPGKPTCIIANTTKGRGVSFMENRPEWHHGIPTDAQLAEAIGELTKARV